MRFAPKTADELARDALLPPGVYPFEVLEALDTYSKAGNEMIKLKLCVFGPDGATPHIYDYLLEKLAYKLRHFAESAGLLERYEAGELTALMCLNREGYVRLIVEEQEGFAPRNAVKDYAPAPSAPPVPRPAPRAPARQAPRPVAEAAAVAAGFDDDVPF